MGTGKGERRRLRGLTPSVLSLVWHGAAILWSDAAGSKPPIRLEPGDESAGFGQRAGHPRFAQAIDNAGAVPVGASADVVGPYQGETPRRSVDLENVRSILETEIGERKEAARQYRDSEAVARMQREESLIESYLAVL